MATSEHKRFLAGDPAAAELIVRRVGRIALPVAIAIVGDRDAAVDVAQDVAVDVLRGVGRLDNPDSFDAWVRRIAARHSIRAALKRRLFHRSEFPLEDADATIAEPQAEDVHLRLALRAALADLSPRERAGLALRYIHGLSDAEIADALGCRTGTASSLLTRARQRLRRNAKLNLEGGTP